MCMCTPQLTAQAPQSRGRREVRARASEARVARARGGRAVVRCCYFSTSPYRNAPPPLKPGRRERGSAGSVGPRGDRQRTTLPRRSISHTVPGSSVLCCVLSAFSRLCFGPGRRSRARLFPKSYGLYRSTRTTMFNQQNHQEPASPSNAIGREGRHSGGGSSNAPSREARRTITGPSRTSHRISTLSPRTCASVANNLADCVGRSSCLWAFAVSESLAPSPSDEMWYRGGVQPGR